MGFTSSSPLPLTAPAVALSEPDICPSCTVSSGLCGRDDCRRAVLPLEARNGGWLKLMGEARVEQRKRQDADELPVSDEQADWRKRKQQARSQKLAKSRKHARAVARSQRRGAFGLAKKIAGH